MCLIVQTVYGNSVLAVLAQMPRHNGPIASKQGAYSSERGDILVTCIFGALKGH